MNISVIGDGGWGTTLAIYLHNKGNAITLWGAFPKYVDYLRQQRINKRFLPGVKIPESIEIVADLQAAIESTDLIILAVPSQYMRQVVRKIKDYHIPKRVSFLSATKGLEIDTLLRMSEVIQEELGRTRLAVLSGPTIAHEVIRGIPTTAVVASYNKELRIFIAGLFNTDRFRIYTNQDVTGVELGGSLKNIIAIACGISDGLGFGTNTKAAVLSRGLAEISRLGIKMGAKPKSFSGISGLGDLVTTCISPFSRNRYVGEQIGKGKTLKQVISKTIMVAEGIPTAKAAYRLALKYRVDMPITKEVYLVLYKNKDPRKAVADLMTRSLKEE
ncbi:MAG: NAD(P)H-dependent glycerol-3-phosphate dehydrogenase [Candidatus Omnitrophota bacterium]|jgi:glycerol-3-phosphate dehydrogenase (NAD(P)+)